MNGIVVVCLLRLFAASASAATLLRHIVIAVAVAIVAIIVAAEDNNNDSDNNNDDHNDADDDHDEVSLINAVAKFLHNNESPLQLARLHKMVNVTLPTDLLPDRETIDIYDSTIPTAPNLNTRVLSQISPVFL